METRNIEFGILVTNGAHTYLEATFLTVEKAVEQAAVLTALADRCNEIFTVVQREVIITLGEWQGPGL